MRMLNVSTVLCCICGKDVERAARVIHHCHLSGTLFGVAHSKCNLRARTTNFLPVFFHNLSRYDAHHILKQLKLKVSEELSAIAKTDETFISFSVNMPVGSYTKKSGKTVKLFQSMRFLDSYQLVSQSLDNLAKTLKTGDLLLKEFFSNIPDQLFCKLTKKVSFHTVSSTASQNLKSLYQILVTWKNSLTGKVDITLQDYQHALDIYKKFGCTNFGDYHDVYLKTDVLLLADIFEKFRSVCLNVYQLDPAHFYSAPIWVGSLCSSRQEWNWDFWKMLICFCFLSVASGVASMELASCGISLRTILISTHSIQVRKQHSAHFMM